MAYSLQPKKMLALNLLELLRKYSDENHRLSQQELLRLLESEYGMTADRKSVRRNLLELQACGYPICCDERPRAGADGEDGTFCTGWYIERAFTDAELRLLIDSLLSSRSLPIPNERGRGVLRRDPQRIKGAPYLGLRFFRRPEGFFQGLWPPMAAWAHRLQTHRMRVFAKGQSRCGAPKRFARQGGCAFAGRDGAFSKQLFRPDVSIFVEICLRRRRASLHKPQKARALRPERGRSPFLVRGSAAARRAGRRRFDAKIRTAAKSARVYIFSLFGAQDKTYKNLWLGRVCQHAFFCRAEKSLCEYRGDVRRARGRRRLDL